MAKFLSKPESNATAGERAFFNRIQAYFEGDDKVLVYFEPYIGNLQPDFLILSPNFGIIIVEIKDYSAKYLRTICPVFL